MIKGTLYCLLGYFFIAVMGLCSKKISPSVPTIMIIFFQNFICLLCTLPHVIKGGVKNLATAHPYLHLARDLTGLISFYALFFCIKYMPLVDAVLLQNTAPLWVPFVIFFWLRKKVLSHIWIGIIIGFIGIIFILKPGPEMFSPALLMGLVCGISLAIALVIIRKLSLTEPITRILFYYFLSGTLVSLPFVIFNWTSPSFTDLMLLISIGIVMYIGQIILTYAFTLAKASTLAPCTYSTIIFSAIFDWLIWHHLPGTEIIGILLVISGGLIILYFENLNEKKLTLKKIT